MKILSMLLDNCRESDRSIGIKLKISGSAVRARRQKMQDAQAIQKYILKVEPPLLGFGVLYVVVTGQDTDEILAQCRLIGKPYLMVPCVGGVTVCGVVVNSMEMQQKIEIAKKLMRDVRILAIFETQRPVAANDSRLTRTDFDILGRLAASPRQRIDIIAKEAKLSAKTVSRCRDRLHANTDIQFTLTYDPKKLKGYIPHVVLAWTEHDPAEAVAKLDEKFSQYYLQMPFLAKNQVVLFMYCKTIFEMDEITQSVRQTEMINRTDLFIPKKIFIYDQWLHDAINDKRQSSKLHIE